MRQLIVLAALIAVFLGGSADSRGQDPNAEANRLFVEAVKLLERAEAAPTPEERLKLYEGVRGNIDRIVDDFPSSDLAVRIVLGQNLGPINLAELARRIAAHQPEVVARERAIERAMIAALSDSGREYVGKLTRPAGRTQVTIRFLSFDPSSRMGTAIMRSKDGTEEFHLASRLENARRLLLGANDGPTVWDLSLSDDGMLSGSYWARWSVLGPESMLSIDFRSILTQLE